MSSLPLAGRRIVVTRAREQSHGVLERLAARGAQAIALPTIEFAPPADWRPLDEALRRLTSSEPAYAGIVFTSANAVRFFFQRTQELQLKPGPKGAWLCAIGPATAAALVERGWQPEVLPEQFVAEGLATALEAKALRGRRILIPRAAEARDVLPRRLRAAGAEAEVVTVYRTIPPRESAPLARRLFPVAGPRPDAVLLTSSSTARNFTDLLGTDYRQLLVGVALAAMGPITAATLAELGLRTAVQARQFTTGDLVEALVAYYAARPEPQR